MNKVQLKCGIEFEYMLVNTDGKLVNFSTHQYHDFVTWLDQKPGRDDRSLAKGDLGIKDGYWYLEGDERFDENGHFSKLEVKGVEIRTPPRSSVEEALASLLDIEHQLKLTLHKNALRLAISAFNPEQPAYVYNPPLNAFEQTLRQQHKEYQASHVSTLTYGPDLNLSFLGMSPEKCRDIARKFTYYAPFIVPFSFNAPCIMPAGPTLYSRRTYERGGLRPSCKYYVQDVSDQQYPLSAQARLPSETGRIEFKAFDAMPDARTLRACFYLLIGLALDHQLEGRSDHPDHALFRIAAQHGFDDYLIHNTANEVLHQAQIALAEHRFTAGLDAVDDLQHMLATRKTPAHRFNSFQWMQEQLFEIRGLGE